MMHVLLLGSGGREHAFAQKISESKRPHRLFIMPGNAGTELHGTNVPGNPSDAGQVLQIIREKNIQMVVCGPEDPLVKGLKNIILSEPDMKNIIFIGPSREAAQLEGSKIFSKHFMKKYHIPTARFLEVSENNLNEGFAFLETLSPPYVIKADGLAAGKGVVIHAALSDAKKELEAFILHNKMGASGKKVVLEEYLHGIECSCFVFTDGQHYQILPFAKDYKRIGEGDTGPNTGGMGSVSPVPFVDDAFIRKTEQSIILPTLQGMQQEGIPYEGFLFIGLMNVNGNPYVIEYNCRMGDPETQSVFTRLNMDFIDWFMAYHEKKLHETTLSVKDECCVTIVLASKGYPDVFEKNKRITLPDHVPGHIRIFCAGVRKENGNWFSNGGRVLAISAMNPDPIRALEEANTYAELVQFENKYFRKDIGKDLFGSL